MKKIIQNIQSLFPLLSNIISVFFSKSETERYPFEKSHLPQRYRGRVAINEENCVGCSLCVLDCPASALELEKDSKTKFRLLHYRDRCTYCGQCEQSCRFDAMYMDNEYIKPAYNRDEFFVILVNRNEANKNSKLS
jgi:formate hydrogenlyase subunit 6/NADH:ubiquinone oxidoreductase subunit I